MPNRDTALFHAIVEKRWHEANKILRDPAKAGAQARHVNRIGTDTATALHVACQYDDTPLHIVKRLLELNPDAALHRTGDGEQTPLFVATSNSSAEIVGLLLEACPRAASVPAWVSSHGETPLHRACSGRVQGLETEKIRLLLRADSSLLWTRNKHGLTPLDLFFSAFNRCMRETEKQGTFSLTCCSLRAMITRRFSYTPAQAGFTSWNFFLSANDLLYAYLHGHWSHRWLHDKEWRVLHASLKVRSCPWVFFKFFLELFPDQAREPDEEGNLPLHIAASADSMMDGEFYECHYCRKSPIYGTRYHHKEYMGVYCSSCTTHFDRSADQYYTLIPADKCAFAIENLLECYPQAATMPNSDSRLPLHLAIEAGKSWKTGIQHLLESNPGALEVRDSKTNLYAFMLAAATAESDKDDGSNDSDAGYDDLDPPKNFAAANRRHFGEVETVLVLIPDQNGQVETIFELLKGDPSLVRTTALAIDH